MSIIANRLYIIDNRFSSKSLKPATNTEGSGIVAATRDPNNIAFFLWWAESVGGSFWRLRHEYTGKYLTLTSNSTGTQATIETSGEQWLELSDVGGAYTMRIISNPVNTLNIGATDEDTALLNQSPSGDDKERFDFLLYNPTTINAPVLPSAIFRHETTLTLTGITDNATVRVYKNNNLIGTTVNTANTGVVSVNVSGLVVGDSIKATQEAGGVVSAETATKIVQFLGEVVQVSETQYQAYEMKVSNATPCNDITQWTGAEGEALGQVRDSLASALEDLAAGGFTIQTNPYCSGGDSGQIATPTLSAVGINSNTIRISWSHTGSVTDFELEYSSSLPTWVAVDGGIFAANVRTVDSTPWASDTLFYFRIRARLSGQVSEWSNAVSATASAGAADVISDTAKGVFDNFLNTNKGAYNNNVQVLIGKNNVVYSYAFGSKTFDTRIGVASLSKWFLGAVVMKAVQDGAISLSTTAGSLIPVLATAGKGSATLKQLMSHTGGWSETSAQWAGGNSFENRSGDTLQQFVENIAAYVPQLYTPGTAYQYSGLGMQIAGKMLENAYSLPYQTIVQNLILTPLGMTKTGYNQDPSIFPETSNPQIAAGIWTSINDFGKFMRMILKQDGTVLNATSTGIMEADQTGLGLGYGIGVYTNGSEPFHQGASGCTAWVNRTKAIWGLIFSYDNIPSSANNKSPEFITTVRNTL